MALPSALGEFGEFGGQYVPDTVLSALDELEVSYKKLKKSRDFQRELAYYFCHHIGRPSGLYFAKNLSQILGQRVYLKREDLNHTGAHKINNSMGQILVAKALGKGRIIAETGAGQHGVATATVCASMNMACVIYMGKKDVDRQSLNVHRMRLLGASVVPVDTGSQTLRDATSAAIRDWLEHVETTHYIIGSVVGPHPYPMMVRDFQSVIGREVRQQIQKQEKRLPDTIIACVGGGSNAMGIFYPFLGDTAVALVAVEAAGKGLDTDQHSASLGNGEIGILHGTKSYVLTSPSGHIRCAHSISAGLDYPGVGPEISHYVKMGRITTTSVTDRDALVACQWVAKKEGIIVALETAHAVFFLKNNPFPKNSVVVLSLSGRGDKDMQTIAQLT